MVRKLLCKYLTKNVQATTHMYSEPRLPLEAVHDVNGLTELVRAYSDCSVVVSRSKPDGSEVNRLLFNPLSGKKKQFIRGGEGTASKCNVKAETDMTLSRVVLLNKPNGTEVRRLPSK